MWSESSLTIIIMATESILYLCSISIKLWQENKCYVVVILILLFCFSALRFSQVLCPPSLPMLVEFGWTEQQTYDTSHITDNTWQKSYVFTPIIWIFSTINHVVTLKEAIIDAEQCTKKHYLQWKRSASLEEWINECPEGHQERKGKKQKIT